MGKSAEHSKLGILNHFRPLWWERIGKSAKPKIGYAESFGHFGGKRLEKLRNNQNCIFQIISDHFCRKRLESAKQPKLGAESFQIILVG